MIKNNSKIIELLKDYSVKKSQIKKRLKEFKKVWKQDDNRIFEELCFCICTPQANAKHCDGAVKSLIEKNILYKGGINEVREKMQRVRFPNNKAKYLLDARSFFSEEGKIKIKEFIRPKDIISTRKWLVKNIKGIGFKEASHFLRNIGFGQFLAILDVHIIKNMIKFGIIKEKPLNINEEVYLDLERKLKTFAEKIKIPMDELDLLFWSLETGEIFK